MANLEIALEKAQKEMDQDRQKTGFSWRFYQKQMRIFVPHHSFGSSLVQVIIVLIIIIDGR